MDRKILALLMLGILAIAFIAVLNLPPTHQIEAPVPPGGADE